MDKGYLAIPRQTAYMGVDICFVFVLLIEDIGRFLARLRMDFMAAAMPTPTH